MAASPVAHFGLSGEPLEGSFWGSFGPSESSLGPSWGPLGPSWRARAVLGPSWGRLGLSWGPPVALSGLSWERFGALRGPSWAVLGLPGAVLGPSWAVGGLSWVPPGRCWGGLGGSSGRLGRSADPKRESGKNIHFPKGMGRFLLRGGPFGSLRGRLGAVWSRPGAVCGASGAVLEPSGAVLERRLRDRGRSESSAAAPRAALSGPMRPRALPERPGGGRSAATD